MRTLMTVLTLFILTCASALAADASAEDVPSSSNAGTSNDSSTASPS